MKKILLSLLFLFGFISVKAQTATSIANGNWTNPFTWNCSCVPTPGYTVTINHAVVLNTSFGYTSGGITINAGASLLDDATGRDMWVNGGSFTNNGTVDFHYFFVQSGTFSNSGIISSRAVATYVNFTNTGTFQNIDSLYSTGNVINNGSFLAIDSITNAGSFTNSGTSVYNQFTNTGTYNNTNMLTFTDVTNIGTFNNYDSIICNHSSWNPGVFNNLSGSYFYINNSILNDDNVAHDAIFNNNGRVRIMDSWYNMDTTKGTTGSFVVQDSTYNSGFMKESFDFCDLTPPSSAPFVDFNFGTISSSITWCVNTGIVDQEKSSISVYPNPANSIINVNAFGVKEFTIRIFDCTGNLVGEYFNLSEINISDYSEGLYFVNLSSETISSTQKVQLVR